MRAREWGVALVAALLWSGCGIEDTLNKIKKDPPQWPFGSMRGVDLVKSPSFNQLAAWTCFDYGGNADSCGLIGFDKKPRKNQMEFGFDLVFDLFNPNTLFAVPLVELLLGLNVYDGQSLGVVCVSFCDPAAEDCDPAAGAEQACQLDEDVENIDELGDLVPTVDDLIDLGRDIVEGNLDDNLHFRTIPKHFEDQCQPRGTACNEDEVDGVPAMCCDGVCEPLATGCSVGDNDNGRSCAVCDGHVEAHIQVDLDVDTTLNILEQMFLDAFDAVINLEPVQFVIPFTVDGTLFFEAPTLGRAAIGFGPFEDSWKF